MHAGISLKQLKSCRDFLKIGFYCINYLDKWKAIQSSNAKYILEVNMRYYFYFMYDFKSCRVKFEFFVAFLLCMVLPPS